MLVVKRKVIPSLTAFMVLAAFALGNVSFAEEDDEHLGLIEYELACMSCHGFEGRGDGPMAKTLNTAPANLTKIAKANNGMFPFDELVEIVDGRAVVAAHGAREMPVWGDGYRISTEPGESLAEIDRRARARIEALVRYLETIQEK